MLLGEEQGKTCAAKPQLSGVSKLQKLLKQNYKFSTW